MFGLTKPQTAVVALIVANIIWGATPPIFKWALEDITPFTLAFLRFFFATLIILPFAARHSLKVQKRDWKNLFLIAFIGIFLHISFFFLGLELSSSINAPIIASSAPLFLLGAGVILFKEHPAVKKLVGGGIGFIGIILIVLLPALGQEIDGSIIGNLFFILSTVAYVVHAVLIKGTSNDYHPMTLVFWSFALASFIFFPMFANDALARGALEGVGIQGLAGVLWGAIFASVISYCAFYFSIKHLPASEVGIFAYLDPVVAIVIAAPLLGEIPTPAYIMGSILVFLGIYIAEGRIHYHPFHLLKKREHII